MARYIDADKLKEILFITANFADLKKVFEGYIDKTPTEDVKPIVYGNWVSIDDEPHEDFECDRCGYIIYGEEFATNFCPNCGADMRKESEEEE